MTPIIHIENVHKHFGKVRAVDGVSVDVPAGEIYGLVGPSGAGKTTLIRLFCGLAAATHGEARLLGHAMPGDRRAVEGRFGYMPQEKAVYMEQVMVHFGIKMEKIAELAGMDYDF